MHGSALTRPGMVRGYHLSLTRNAVRNCNTKYRSFSLDNLTHAQYSEPTLDCDPCPIQRAHHSTTEVTQGVSLPRAGPRPPLSPGLVRAARTSLLAPRGGTPHTRATHWNCP